MLNRRLLAVLIALILALPAAPGIVSAQGGEEVRLTLDECLRTALENNLDLVSARKDPEIREQNIDVSKAALDPSVGAEGRYNRRDTDQDITGIDPDTGLPVTLPGTADNETTRGILSWTDPLAFGGSYSATLTYDDADQVRTGINIYTGFFEESTYASSGGDLTLSYEMPLLQGFGKEVNTIDILLARSDLEMSREDLRLQAMLTMKDVEDAYWDLLAARAALDVANESLDLARDLYELNRKKVEVGTLAPIEVTQAEAGVASREEGVIVAENAVENAEDNLCRLLAIPPDAPMWEQSVVPTDRPLFEERAVDVQVALETAMDQRPEAIVARRQVQDSELSERVARRNTRHGLSLNVDYTPGRSDWEYSTFYPALGERTNDSSTDETRSGWSVGLVYRYPLKNRQAKANYAIAQINLEKSGLALQNVEQDIRVDVRTAARNVVSGGKRVAAAQANTTLQRKTLEAEQRKFENGMSTSFEVLRIQTDLSDARLAEIRAILDYTKALADFERAKGTLLEARGLALGS
jgi:outer membrane protein TolC